MARYSKSDLVNDLALHDLFANASKRKVTEFVEDYLQIITDKVAAGDEVAIANFGKFSKYIRQNGQAKPKFTAYGEFKSAVN